MNAEHKLTCDVCGRQCSSRPAMRRHVDSHVLKPRISCDECDKSFTRATSLYHHRRAMHSAVKPYKCELCGETFNFNHSMKLHMLKHAGQRPHQCATCGKSYLTATHLKKHVEAIHSITKQFVCQICNKSFGYKTSYRQHKMLHANNRPFTCAMCGRSFVTRGALRDHEEAHSGDPTERPYRCEVCARCYRTPTLLRAHARRHTTDVARHVCEVCGRTFMYRSNLEMHATVHTGQRDFTCRLCGKAFKTAATLYTHGVVHQLGAPRSSARPAAKRSRRRSDCEPTRCVTAESSHTAVGHVVAPSQTAVDLLNTLRRCTRRDRASRARHVAKLRTGLTIYVYTCVHTTTQRCSHFPSTNSCLARRTPRQSRGRTTQQLQMRLPLLFQQESSLPPTAC